MCLPLVKHIDGVIEMHTLKPVLSTLFVLLVVAACTSTKVKHTTNEFVAPDKGTMIVLVEPDAELGILMGTGMSEPRADWSQQAQLNLAQAYRAELGLRDHRFTDFRPTTNLSSQSTQITKLFNMVADAVLSHGYGPVKLPTKKNTFDWTLGSGARSLAQGSGAKYALFTLARGAYPNAGIQTMRAVSIILNPYNPGNYIPSTQQVGFVALIELETGDIVWTNFTQMGVGTGDLRKEAGAKRMVQLLLKDIPL